MLIKTFFPISDCIKRVLDASKFLKGIFAVLVPRFMLKYTFPERKFDEEFNAAIIFSVGDRGKKF